MPAVNGQTFPRGKTRKNGWRGRREDHLKFKKWYFETICYKLKKKKKEKKTERKKNGGRSVVFRLGLLKFDFLPSRKPWLIGRKKVTVTEERTPRTASGGFLLSRVCCHVDVAVAAVPAEEKLKGKLVLFLGDPLIFLLLPVVAINFIIETFFFLRILIYVCCTDGESFKKY